MHKLPKPGDAQRRLPLRGSQCSVGDRAILRNISFVVGYINNRVETDALRAHSSTEHYENSFSRKSVILEGKWIQRRNCP